MNKYNKIMDTDYFSMRSLMKPRRMRWAGHVAHIGEKRNTYRISVGKPEGKRTLGRKENTRKI
jgi:hypothetical protein